MSEIPPTPNPTPSPTPPLPQPTPPTDNPLIPSWFFSLNVLLLIAGILVILIVTYLTYRLLTKNTHAASSVKIEKSDSEIDKKTVAKMLEEFSSRKLNCMNGGNVLIENPVK